MGQTGRPTKLDGSTQQIICNAIRNGLGYEQAATLAGIEYYTFRRWILRAEAELKRLEEHPRARMKQREKLYCDFCEAVQRAKAEGEQFNADVINQAAAGGVTYTETKQVKAFDPATQAFIVTEETITIKVTQPDWRAAAFVLERRHPERWTRHQKTELSGPDGQPIQITSIEPVKPEDDPGTD